MTMKDTMAKPQIQECKQEVVVTDMVNKSSGRESGTDENTQASVVELADSLGCDPEPS